MTVLYLIVFVMVSSLRASDCPSGCTCIKIPRYELQTESRNMSVRCGYIKNLTHLPPRTYKLTIADTKLDINEFMYELIAKNITYLAHLSFDNCIVNVSGDIETENHLKILKLIHSQLNVLPNINATNLQILDVSNNQLKLVNEPFRNLISLEVLNLSANSINNLNISAFVGLENLKCLDLSENDIAYLDDDVLLPVGSLQHLNLSNNRIEILNEACFSSLSHLQQLDISWNRLAHVVPGNLELPSLARLLLADNPSLGRSRKPTLLVGTGRRLQTVDASRTGLKQVPAALTHSIRTLRLAGNSIRSVNCGDLDSYPLLQLLDFSANELKTIEDDALGRLESLTILYLTENILKAIPKSLPEKLKVLHLEKNEIESIRSNDLINLKQIEVLLLSYNKIHLIEESGFAQLDSLVTLDLSHNPINNLPAGMLSEPGNLQVLRLSGIGALPPVKEVAFPLTAPEHLVILDLSNSPGLAHQLMADTAALAASRELQELNLHQTDLKYVRSDLLHFLPQLRILHLSGNPINCTNMQWLASWLRKQDTPEYQKVTCASPPDLWGTPLVDLQIMKMERETTSDVTVQIQLNTFDNEVGSLKNDDYQIFPTITYTKRVEDYFVKSTAIPMKTASNNTNNYKKKIDTINKTIVTESYFNNTEVGNETFTNNYKDDSSSNFVINVTASTGEMSMYSAENGRRLSHPGMLIIIICILVTGAVLAMLMSRFAKQKRMRRQEQAIEVNSIPSVTELW